MPRRSRGFLKLGGRTGADMGSGPWIELGLEAASALKCEGFRTMFLLSARVATPLASFQTRQKSCVLKGDFASVPSISV